MDALCLGPFSQTRYISLYLPHKCTHFICIGISLSHMLTISLGVSGSLRHMLFLYLSLSLSLSDYCVPLFSLISVGKHYFSHMHIYTRTVSTSPLYAHIYMCLRVSRTHIIFRPLSHTLLPPTHLSLSSWQM